MVLKLQCLFVHDCLTDVFNACSFMKACVNPCERGRPWPGAAAHTCCLQKIQYWWSRCVVSSGCMLLYREANWSQDPALRSLQSKDQQPLVFKEILLSHQPLLHEFGIVTSYDCDFSKGAVFPLHFGCQDHVTRQSLVCEQGFDSSFSHNNRQDFALFQQGQQHSDGACFFFPSEWNSLSSCWL